MITSLKNDRVRLIRSLQQRRRVRQRERLVVIEGIRLCREAQRTGVVPSFVLFTREAQDDRRVASLLAEWRERGVVSLPASPEVMAGCSDTQSPQGIIAVVPRPVLSPPPHPTFSLVLDRIRDPGNLGAILRTSLAAGVDQVLLTPGTVDAANPKVMRAGMGAHFWLPIRTVRWDGVKEAVGGSPLYLAAARGGVDYTEVDWRNPAALVIGGEAEGAGPQARERAAGLVTIPLSGKVESLNAAAAAAVILFEAARQRRASVDRGGTRDE